MPEWVQDAKSRVNTQYSEVGLSADEVVQLAAAFRLYGFWRLDLDAGHVFLSPDACRVFGLQPHDGPIDILAIKARIHPDDFPILLSTYELASAQRLSYHNIYRVKADAQSYKYVRSIGKFRDRPNSSGEVVGITYEFFARRPGVTFFLDEVGI